MEGPGPDQVAQAREADEGAAMEASLPAHSSTCMICGEAPAEGLHASRTVVDNRVVLRFTPSKLHEGTIGTVHGGLIAAAFDEVLGSVPVNVLGRFCATASLTVSYRSPAKTGSEIRMEAWVEEVDGRKVHLQGKAHSEDGLLAEASATFIELPPGRAPA